MRIAEIAVVGLAVGIGEIAVVGAPVLVLVAATRLGRKRKIPATIRGIQARPPPMASPKYHTWVQFSGRGEVFELKVPRRLWRTFSKSAAVGDTGTLTRRRRRVVSWERAAPKVVADGVRVFLSYPHETEDDARWVEEHFERRGAKVWIDREELNAGGELSRAVFRELRKADWFVPLLNAAYWHSDWCVREFEAALEAEVAVKPVQVTPDRGTPPPHLRRPLRTLLDETVHVDLHGENPNRQLDELVEAMAAGRGG